MNRLLEYSYITVPRGEEIRKGKKYKAIHIILTNNRADFSIALLLIDVLNNRIAETENNTKKDSTYNLIMNYENNSKALPSLVEVNFKIEKIKIPLNFMGKDTCIDRKKNESRVNENRGKSYGKLPQKEYGLKIDKKFINLNYKNEKESIQSHTDCQHPKGF